MYFPDRWCVRTLRTMYDYATDYAYRNMIAVKMVLV